MQKVSGPTFNTKSFRIYRKEAKEQSIYIHHFLPLCFFAIKLMHFSSVTSAVAKIDHKSDR
jgi:hypothetical protein